MTIKTFAHSIHHQLQTHLSGSPIKKSHIYELFAAAFGFKSYAALKSCSVFWKKQPEYPIDPLDINAVMSRYISLGYPAGKASVVSSNIIDFLNESLLVAIKLSDLIVALYGTPWASLPDYDVEDEDIESGYKASLFHDSQSLIWGDYNTGEPEYVLLSELDAKAKQGDALAHFALAIVYEQQDQDSPEGSEYWYRQTKIGRKLVGADKELAEAYALHLERDGKYNYHLREAARLGLPEAMLELGKRFEDPIFFDQDIPPFDCNPLAIAELAEELYREEDAKKWLTIAAEKGDTEAMRRLIENYDSDDLQQCWVWFYLAKLCGDDLSKDHLYAIHEDGSLYDDDIGGSAFVDGVFGIQLDPLKQEDEMKARLAANKLFANIDN